MHPFCHFLLGDVEQVTLPLWTCFLRSGMGVLILTSQGSVGSPMNIKVLTNGRYLGKKKKGLGWGWEAQETWSVMAPAQALVPLGVLHTDPAAWGQTLALNP